MVNPDNPIQGTPLAKSVAKVAASLNVQVDTVPARSLVELESGIESFAATRADAVVFNRRAASQASNGASIRPAGSG